MRHIRPLTKMLTLTYLSTEAEVNDGISHIDLRKKPSVLVLVMCGLFLLLRDQYSLLVSLELNYEWL